MISSNWNLNHRIPLGGPEDVLQYLGRYSYRVAISNRRLIEMREDQVTFSWRDSADRNAQ